MKRAHQHLIAVALLTLGFAATAQTAAAPSAPGTGPSGHPHEMMGHHGHMDPGRMKERMAQRQSRLKQKLQITPAQENAWNAYVAAMQPPANLQRPDPAELARLTTPERIDRMRALRNAHHAEMDKRGEATKTFYAALTPEQRKVFDTEGARAHRDGHFRAHRGHHI